MADDAMWTLSSLTIVPIQWLVNNTIEGKFDATNNIAFYFAFELPEPDIKHFFLFYNQLSAVVVVGTSPEYESIQQSS